MRDHARVPPELRAVAVLQFLLGAGALVDAVVRLTQDMLRFDASLLGIPICIGLLRLVAAWRTCALFCLWGGMVLVPIVTLAVVLGSGPLPFVVFGVPSGMVSRPWLMVVSAAVFALSLWQYRVLVSPRVRGAFAARRALVDEPRESVT